MVNVPALSPAVSASLYQRLGGAVVVAAIVDDMVDRHAANPALTLQFQGQDLPQLKTLAVTFLSASTGGPRERLAADPGPWYAGLGVSPRQLAAMADDVNAALREQGIGAGEAHEVVRLFCAAGQRYPAEASS